MVAFIIILAIALAICIYVIVGNSNAKEEALRLERKYAEEKYREICEREKNSYRKKLDREYEQNFKKLTEERDKALALASSLESSNYELRSQTNGQQLRICELEAQYGKFMKRPELSQVFLRILSMDASSFLQYMDFVDFFFSHHEIIKNRLNSLLPAHYETGKTDIVAHLSDEHLLSVSLPTVSIENLKIQGSSGEYSTSLSSCTCQDYMVRKRPCKHMLALAKQFDLLWIYGTYINAEINQRIRKLIAFSKEKAAEVETYAASLEARRTEFEESLKLERDTYLNDLIVREKELIRSEKAIIRQETLLADKEKALAEKLQSYPWLASRLADLEMQSKSIRIRDPILKSDMTALLKKQTKEIALLKNQLAVYEYLFPILEEFKELPPQNIESMLSKASDEGFRYQWLSEDEYEVLTSREKSDRWIQRYFGDRSKSAWEAGIKYERYIGYLCEQKGYTVKYNGAVMCKEDMGRDLIVSKGKNVYVVQCKRFAPDKEIHENHVFQLLGSVIHLRATQPNKTVTGVFVTSAKLSDIARECADVIGLQVYENVKFEQYPIIKCNIGRDGQKIYHLPYDQQYDRISIEPHKGELYCATCAEAEENGFRHAWKHYVS